MRKLILIAIHKYIKDYNNEFRFNTDSKFVSLYIRNSELILSYLNDNLINNLYIQLDYIHFLFCNYKY